MKSGDELIEEHNENTFQYVAFFAKWLSPGLFIIFLIADFTVMEEHFASCLFIRFWMLPISLVVAMSLRSSTGFKARQRIAFAFVMANALLILPLIYLGGGFHSIYFAGLMLVMMGGLGFLPFDRVYSVSIYSLTIVLYYVVCFAKNGFSSATVMLMLTNSLFLIGAAVLSIYVRRSFAIYEVRTADQRARLRESKDALERQSQFLEVLNGKLEENQLRLQTTLNEREKIIREKTEENIHLHFLKSHFSPQVIEHLDKGASTKASSEICVMFVDIVDSTSRINSIDEFKFNKIISFFIDEVARILLKHNVTIDKFLGDGIIAYSNHPIKQHDYISLICSAAIEIKEFFLSQQGNLSKEWEGKFEIRIGLAHGSANIGSFGSVTQHYTGIGGVFNLSQRVCASAHASQIYVTSAMSERLNRETFHLKSSAVVQLKGFKEQANLYELVGHNIYVDGSHCPHGHGQLRMRVNQSKIYTAFCPVCGYEE